MLAALIVPAPVFVVIIPYGSLLCTLPRNLLRCTFSTVEHAQRCICLTLMLWVACDFPLICYACFRGSPNLFDPAFCAYMDCAMSPKMARRSGRLHDAKSFNVNSSLANACIQMSNPIAHNNLVSGGSLAVAIRS